MLNLKGTITHIIAITFKIDFMHIVINHKEINISTLDKSYTFLVLSTDVTVTYGPVEQYFICLMDPILFEVVTGELLYLLLPL